MRVALVLGGAACVWEDVEAALQLGEFAGAVGCNHVGIAWPGQLDAWVSLHGDYLEPWARSRARRGLLPHHRVLRQADTQARWPGQENPGSSSMFALKVALADLGFDRAVICGAPLLPEAEHFDAAGSWDAASEYHAGWRQALPHIRDRARSMSGWTGELLGRPDAEWVRA